METQNVDTSYGECRCCLTKGHHRDMTKECYENGMQEVFLDIFLECFNLYLSTDHNLGTLICSSCTVRLRDANYFRAMVIDSERQLLERCIDLDKPPDDVLALNIKQEPDGAFKTETDTDVDDEDEPLEETRFEATSIPSPEPAVCPPVPGEAELLSRFSRNSLRPLPRRNALYKLCPGFAVQLDALRSKVVLPKMIEKLLNQQNVARKTTVSTERRADIENAKLILESTNVTPFKPRMREGVACFYCRSVLDDLQSLKDHQRLKHSKIDLTTFIRAHSRDSWVVYADVSDLKCTLCDQSIPNMTLLKEHLTKIHNKIYYTDHPDKVIPFKLSEIDKYQCQVCFFSFPTFVSIHRHMNVHYRNYVCEKCGAGFITKHRLSIHTKSHFEQFYTCQICGKEFSNHSKYTYHVNITHNKAKKNKCPKCPERFTDYYYRQLHLAKVHGVCLSLYKCNVCGLSYTRQSQLTMHMRRTHMNDRHVQCELCEYKCYSKMELKNHMVKHSNERLFKCVVCKKSYARKKTLREHMRTHNNDRRFACAVCGQAFIQKCSLKGHIKTHHLEYSLELGLG